MNNNSEHKTMNTSSNAKNYTLNLIAQADEGFDWDDLYCMMQQVHAIHAGWADPIKVFEYPEDKENNNG